MCVIWFLTNLLNSELLLIIYVQRMFICVKLKNTYYLAHHALITNATPCEQESKQIQENGRAKCRP